MPFLRGAQAGAQAGRADLGVERGVEVRVGERGALADHHALLRGAGELRVCARSAEAPAVGALLKGLGVGRIVEASLGVARPAAVDAALAARGVVRAIGAVCGRGPMARRGARAPAEPHDRPRSECAEVPPNDRQPRPAAAPRGALRHKEHADGAVLLTLAREARPGRSWRKRTGEVKDLETREGW